MDSPRLTSNSGGVPAEPQAGVAPVRWVEPDILAELEEELDGPELAFGFARDYASLWDLRFSRLAAAVHTEDRPAALDAVISLRIASAMVGGIRLSALAQVLEDAIRRNDFVHGQALLTIVAEHGVRTVSELQASYILKND
ncbi:UNVERIFIED_ORG: HPt (histidine-containing phosphotransfer) domain-containing protein [Arthrobacter sp. UYEF2]